MSEAGWPGDMIRIDKLLQMLRHTYWWDSAYNPEAMNCSFCGWEGGLGHKVDCWFAQQLKEVEAIEEAAKDALAP